MAIITIVGAGLMGTAVAWPLADNGHDVRLVGTHLDADIIRSCLERRYPSQAAPPPAGWRAPLLRRAARRSPRRRRSDRQRGELARRPLDRPDPGAAASARRDDPRGHQGAGGHRGRPSPHPARRPGVASCRPRFATALPSPRSAGRASRGSWLAAAIRASSSQPGSARPGGTAVPAGRLSPAGCGRFSPRTTTTSASRRTWSGWRSARR